MDETIPSATELLSPDDPTAATEVQATEAPELVTQATESPTAAPDEWTEPVAQETQEVILVDAIQTAATDLAHVYLFGSFLICGTLVGIFLLRNRHAN